MTALHKDIAYLRRTYVTLKEIIKMKEKESHQNGYVFRHPLVATKRYCQTLSLRDNPELIAEYKSLHSEEKSWKVIRDGIRSVGIIEMEMYIYGTTVCMIVDTSLDFDWDSAMKKLATLPRQQEWEDTVAQVQNSLKGATSAEKWHLMERFFYLYD
mgnify:CR=1 FL=1|jgi:L-rhamnose mutarotase